MKRKTALEIMEERYGKRPGFKKAVAREKELSEQDPAVVLARLVKAVRKKIKISQEELAERLNVTQPRISQIESESAEGYQMDAYIRLINALGCTFRIHIDLPEEFTNENTSSVYEATFSPEHSAEA